MSQAKQFKIEPFFSVSQALAVFPSKSEKWIRTRAQQGEFGRVVRDETEWLIPRSGLLAYLERHAIDPQALADDLPAGKQCDIIKLNNQAQ